MINERVHFKFLFNRSYKIDNFNITCNSYNKNKGLFCFGTKEGSLLFTPNNFDEILFKNSKFKILNRYITDTEICSVDWLTDTKIGCTYTNSVYCILDILTDKLSMYELDKGSINFIKKSEKNTFYTCGRDKTAKKWDIRTMKFCMELFHTGSVTCLEKHNKNDKLLYTTSTPGTIINYWDTRYTKRGIYFSNSTCISNFYCKNLVLFKNNLYSKNKISQIHKISESGKQKSLLLDIQSSSICGSITYNSKYDCLFTPLDNKVFSITDSGMKQVNLEYNLNFTGCISYNDDTVLLHNSQDIFIYQINPLIK